MKFLHQTAKKVAIATTVALSWSASAQAADLTMKDGPMAKLSSDLGELLTGYQTNSLPPNSLLQISDGYVAIDAVASGDTQTLLTDLQAMGLQDASTYGSFVSGLLPIEATEQMANLDSLQLARPTYRPETNVGLTTSQADQAMRADVARSSFNVDGTGVTVGELSDSFNNMGGAANDVANNDLPPNVNVLSDLPSGGTDEGRAMMQLIHDVAPGANLAYHTAFNGEADFANGITRLANEAGADVIVDDVIYLSEPMFQDGIVAQAVDNVAANGVSYFSAALNQDRNSYESSFRPSGQSIPEVGELHDFDPGPGVDPLQSITVPTGEALTLTFQWDSPFFSVSPGSGGSPNDLDIYVLDNSGNVLAGSTTYNIGGDALEIFEFINNGSFGTEQFNIAIANFDGPNPGLMKYILFGFGGTVNEFNTASSTVFGHPNATGAEAVGAAFYGNTPEFGVDPALLERFSSAGIVPILFDENGNRLPTPLFRLKPGIVAPDGTNTTFFTSDIPQDPDTFPNFFGTSAAAPHAAAVAALMLDRAPGTSPSTIYATLRNTALDMNGPGFDTDSQ